MLTRHILTLENGRRVHYRRYGRGPALLMVHQSPRSSAEYEGLMREWGAHFTCIAPDTPGFGQSDALPGEPEIAEFADALANFVRALGLKRVSAYGFHSGGIILVTALKRHGDLFDCLAIGGYAIWTPAEMTLFGEAYLPPFEPQPYGEHLAWLWNRMLEQSWVFPWFDTREEARLPGAHADPAKVHQAVMEMLDADSAYQAGYGAVLRASRDIPRPDARTAPVLITAYDGDPLQAHIDRLGEMPAGWEAAKVATAEEHRTRSLAFLQHHARDVPCPDLAEDADEGWLALDDGLLHWKGQPGARRLTLHAPGGELADGELAIDAPGHGLSDPCDDPDDAIREAMAKLGTSSLDAPTPPAGDPDRLYPDLTPQRFGEHLQRAWGIARAEAFFAPWYEANRDTAIPFDPAQLEPPALARRARARLRAGAAAKPYHHLLQQLQERAP